jgi:hypothetical protein
MNCGSKYCRKYKKEDIGEYLKNMGNIQNKGKEKDCKKKQSKKLGQGEQK